MKKGLSAPISTRLNLDDYEKIIKIVNKTSRSKSEILREFIYNKNPVIIAKKPKHQQEERAKAVFLLAKASNNINQIAHQLNTAKLQDRITSKELNITLSKLNNISKYLKMFVDHVD